jgi:hypothetical protein
MLPLTRDEAIRWALDATDRHDKIEDRLLELEVFLRTTGLKDAEREEAELLWDAHDLCERETLSAYAVLKLLDPEACRRLREGDAP